MNDERPIEKLLRRYAKKRHADAGPPGELHPATRRLLQGEVTRQFRKAAPGNAPSSFAQTLKGWRPQLAWAVPLFVLVAVGLWSLLDRPGTKQLALGPAPNKTTTADGSRASNAERRGPESLPSTLDARPSTAVETAPAEFSAVKAMPPSPAPVPIRSLNQPAPGPADHGLAGKNRDAEQALAYGAVPDQPVVLLNGAAEQKGEAARGGFKEVERVDKLGVVSSAAPVPNRPRAEVPSDPRPSTLDPRRQAFAPLLDTPSSSATLARSDGLERDQAQTYSQSFANLAPEPLKQKTAKVFAPTPISPVLANFRVEQTGRQLRVVDSDGSTYLGETDTTPVIGAGGGGAKKEQVVQLFKSDGKLNQLPAAATSVPQQQLQNNSYRVAGTNRTLNQTVVFTWNFVEMTNAPVVAQSGRTGSDLNKDAKKLPTQFPAQLQNSFINGRAQFGTGKEIEINAVPVSP